MVEFLVSFVASLFRSILVSAVIFVGFYSYTTGDFPPKISKMKETIAGYRELAKKAHEQLQIFKNLEAQGKIKMGPGGFQRVIPEGEDGAMNLSSGFSAAPSPEVTKLRNEIELLKSEIKVLKFRVDSLSENK